MKRFLNILAAAAVILSAASCDLELFPKGSLNYEPGNTITSANDLAGFEAGVVAQLRGLEYGQYDQVSDIMVDYYNAVSDYGNNYGGVHRTDDSFTAGDYDTRDNWSGPYGAIRHFNIAIDETLAISGDLATSIGAKAKVARGEAYFARALAYLHMVRHFGKPYGSSSSSDLGVPLVLHYEQTARPARNTVQEVYDQIKADLDSAAYLLSGVAGSARAQRPTVDAVNALLARYYLDTKQYAKAASSALAVINTGNYVLASTDSLMTEEWLNDSGKEPIMQFYASISEGGVGYHTYISPSMAIDDDGNYYYRPYFIPTQTLLDSYEDSDIRKAAWYDDYSTSGYTVYINGTYYEDIKVLTKYKGNPALRSSDTPNGGQAIKPFLISEMYLIAAEAYAQAGDATNAETYLNALQTARGASVTSGSLANIKAEWFKETVGEGLRFSCLKRWGDGFSGRTPQPNALSSGAIMTGASYEQKSMPASDNHYQWPIPTYDMQINANLVQNDGYAAVAVE